VTMDQAMPMVRLDPIALTQIWQNLISNALKYRRNEAPQVHAGVSDITQSDVTFVVADNGIGINPKNHERVFRFFQRLNAEHQGMTRGSGIGLALCDRIVRAAGGHIWVESDGETGSRFYFTLPIHGPEEIP